MEPFWIACGIGLVGALAGWGLATVSRPRVAVILGVIGLAVAGALVLKGRQEQGWDAIGYLIGAVILVGPAALGCLMGGLVEWLRRRRNRG